MKKIQFSHDYVKLHGQKYATLLAVFEMTIRKEDISSPLLDFDTLTTSDSHYDFGTGAHVLLVFVGDRNIMFTTIRPRYNAHKADKLEYYSGLIGQPFEIVINEKEN